jgi:hypothetical protein
MEYVLALAVGGGLVWLGYRLRAKRSEGRERVEALAQLRKLCEEDLAVLAENLRRVDAEAADRPLDEDSWVDYQSAVSHTGLRNKRWGGSRMPTRSAR